MGMSDSTARPTRPRRIATIHRALDLGVTLLDTADMYGPLANESLVGKAIAGRRDEVSLATKFGISRDPDDPLYRGVSGEPEYVHACCEPRWSGWASTTSTSTTSTGSTAPRRSRRPSGPWPSWSREGKVRHLGLSEASPATLRARLPSTPSPRCRPSIRCSTATPSDEILPPAGELGIGFVRYSPLGRGLLGGTIRKAGDMTPDDLRLQSPRYQGDNLAPNVALVENVRGARQGQGLHLGAAGPRLGPRPGQGHRPIPGTKRRTTPRRTWRRST